MDENKHPGTSKEVIIIGAGPAGLTAAYSLGKRNRQCLVLEKDNQVGGISRTEHYKGYYFDIGGHRFFTKHKRVEDCWQEVLNEDMLRRSRLSRIYYNKKFFYYPLRPLNAFSGLGLTDSLLLLGSYLYSRSFPVSPVETFEDWVSNRFGRRLYETFFKTYTEKVWGIPCTELHAEWAHQRIKDLSVRKILKNALFSGNGQAVDKNTIATLIEEFDYPKYGPGMMWQRMADLVGNQGSEILMNTRVEKIYRSGLRIEGVAAERNGNTRMLYGRHFLSTMPIQHLVQNLSPEPAAEVLEAAAALRYRDFLTVALIVDRENLFPDNWIYVHEPEVRVGRIQNFKNWSPFMVPDSAMTCLGLEYFCFEKDDLWSMSDADLIELATDELVALKFIQKSDVVDGTVVRMPKAYPIYDAAYKPAMNTLRKFLESLENLQVIGRNGMHRYNNQDHSMLTAMLAADNILGARNDLWQVNDEEETYHEEIRASEMENSLIQPLSASLAKIDILGAAVALGAVWGLLLFLATVWLVVKGGDVVGPHLGLLSQYYWGYSVSLPGAVVGLAYGFLNGFIIGSLFAFIKNFLTALYAYHLKRKSELLKFQDFLDHF